MMCIKDWIHGKICYIANRKNTGDIKIGIKPTERTKCKKACEKKAGMDDSSINP